MSKKQQLKTATEDLKKWALDNTAPSGLHTLIQKLHEEIETMDDGEAQAGDPGGNHPPSKPKVP